MKLFSTAGVMLLALSTSAAHAGMTDCWIGEAGSSADLTHRSCNHTSRVNANGHKVQDIVMYNGSKTYKFTLVIWTESHESDEGDLEMISDGQVLKVPYFLDEDNDYRWSAGDYDFAFRPYEGSSSSRPTTARTRSRPPVDLNRPMGTGLRRPSTHSEYGL